MYKFFLVILLLSASLAYSSIIQTPMFANSLREQTLNSNLLFRSQQGSPHSLSIESSLLASPTSSSVIQPYVPQSRRLLNGIENRVTERNVPSAVVITMPPDNANCCHCPRDQYCRLTICFFAYLIIMGAAGGIFELYNHKS